LVRALRIMGGVDTDRKARQADSIHHPVLTDVFEVAETLGF
jgi:hypothetical protein